MDRKRRLSGTEIPRPVAASNVGPLSDPARALRDLTQGLQKLSIADVNQDQSTSQPADPALPRHAQNISNKEPPTLMTLSGELRTMIYEYAFSQRVELSVTPQSATERGAALLCTCAQIYDEGLELCYEREMFFSEDMPTAFHWAWNRDIGTRPKDVCWEHVAREPEPSKDHCDFFTAVKTKVMKTYPNHFGDAALKTFYYCPDGKLVWHYGGEVPE